MTKIFIYFFSSLAEIYIAKLFFSRFGKYKHTKKTGFVMFAGMCVLQTLNSVLLVDTGFVIIGTVAVFFVMSLGYKLKWFIRIITSLTLCILMSLCEMIVVLLTTLGGKTDVPTIQSNVYLFAVCVFLAKFFSYFIVNLMSIKKQTVSAGGSFGIVISVVVLPLTSIFIITLLYHCCYLISSNRFQVMTLIASVLLILTNALVFTIINKQCEYVQTKEQLFFARQNIKQQMEYYKSVNKSEEEIKIFRHDIKNYLLSLRSALEKGSLPVALKSIDEKIFFISVQ